MDFENIFPAKISDDRLRLYQSGVVGGWGEIPARSLERMDGAKPPFLPISATFKTPTSVTDLTESGFRFCILPFDCIEHRSIRTVMPRADRAVALHAFAALAAVERRPTGRTRQWASYGLVFQTVSSVSARQYLVAGMMNVIAWCERLLTLNG